MAEARRKPGRLAARIVRVTLIGGMVTILIAGIVAIAAVSDLASDRAAARDLIALRLLEGAIEERLRTAAAMLDRTAAVAARSRTPAELADAVGLIATANRAVLAELAVAEIPAVNVLYSFPSEVGRLRVRRSPAFLAAIRGSSGFMSATGSDGTTEIWATRTTVTGWGVPVVVLARLDDGFIVRSLDRAVEGRSGRVALLLDGGRMVAFAGSERPLTVESARWTAEAEGLGRVSLRDVSGRWYRGYYFDVQTAGELPWRVVAAEPAHSDLIATLRAVAAPVAVLIVGGIIAALIAWGVTTRLVRPLRDLERTARTAASGAYVKPLPTGTNDEIGRVADAFNQVALRLNALHDLSQLLASASRSDQVFDGILLAMEHIVGQGAAAIYVVDSQRERLVPARVRGVSMAGAGPIDLRSGGWLATALRSAGPLIYDGDPAALVDELPGLTGTPAGALAAPLIAGHEPLGIVVMLREDTSPVTDAELEMVRTFSAQAAVAVQTSRLFEDESEARRTAEALRSVTEQLVRPDALDAALRSVEETIREFFHAHVVHIALEDRAALGLTAEQEPGRADMFDLAMSVLDKSEQAIVLEYGADARADAILDAYDGSHLVVIPIALESGHGGAMLAVLSQRPEAPMIDVAHALADEIALALDNAYFYERAVMRARNLETIFRISQAVASSLNVNVVLNRVLDVVQKILSADAVVLWSHDARRRTLEAEMVRGEVPAHLVHLEMAPDEDLPGRVFTTGEPVRIADLRLSKDGVARSAAQHGLRSLLAVPLLARGEPIGVLMVLSKDVDAFSDEEMSVLQTFASQAALAIDTARSYSREHEVARVLQDSILPGELPQFPEIDVGSEYEPAGDDADIGGDYYDLFRAPDGAIWLVIADVCGKGVHAATKTSMIKYALRALVAAGGKPAWVVSEVNRMVAETGSSGDIVTAWVGRFDPERGVLSWCNGGHPPAIVRRADGTIERLEGTGPVLGASAGAPFGERSTRLQPGDKVLLYTDGVIEARRGNTFFGEDRAVEALSADRSAAEDARALLESVKTFVDGRKRDDIAVLVVAVRSVEAREAG